MPNLKNMSSKEIYELAKQREAEERANSTETAEKVAALKADRKALVAEQRKALNAIDREIAKLTGGSTRRRSSGGGAPRGRLSGRVLEMLGEGEASGRELRARLTAEGIDATYVSQCLAGLKKQGKVTSPSRGNYKLA